MASEKKEEFVVLPLRGLRGKTAKNTPAAIKFLVANATPGPRRLAKGRSKKKRSAAATRVSAAARGVKVIDSIREDGAKLIEATPSAALALRAEQPGIRVIPVVYFTPALAPRPTASRKPKAAKHGVGSRLTLRIVAKSNGKPVPSAFVVAFTDFAEEIGDDGTTDKSGKVRLDLGGSKKLDRLYVYPDVGFWSLLKKNLTVKNGDTFAVQDLDLGFSDCVDHFYDPSKTADGKGVKIGVIDTGVDVKHPDLRVAGGLNTVRGEKSTDFGDNGGHHGTHVAGIIAARGKAPTGRTGIAPGATLYSYRVFGRNSDDASNFAIAKAIDRAVQDGCDLINLSLGGEDPDPLTSTAVADARSAGSLCIVAAGNDGRGPVNFPGADERAVAVSALGRKGMFPKGTTETDDMGAPFGTQQTFVAKFSNIGLQIDVIGPGVGVISTVPGGYGVMSGTSMACPAVTGFVARLLSRQKSILKMKRTQARSDAMAEVLFQAARTLGFAPRFEGHGLPR